MPIARSTVLASSSSVRIFIRPVPTSNTATATARLDCFVFQNEHFIVQIDDITLVDDEARVACAIIFANPMTDEEILSFLHACLKTPEEMVAMPLPRPRGGLGIWGGR